MDRICRQRYDHKAMRGANKAERQSALADRSAYLTELQDYERTLQEKYKSPGVLHIRLKNTRLL